jgi:hypothetical protein
MQAIKALVIGMGLVLVLGIGLLGYGLYRNAAKSSASAGAASFGTVMIPSAPGAKMVDMLEADGRLAVLLEEGAGRRIVVLDPASGGIAGTFVLAPAP